MKTLAAIAAVLLFFIFVGGTIAFALSLSRFGEKPKTPAAA